MAIIFINGKRYVASLGFFNEMERKTFIYKPNEGYWITTLSESRIMEAVKKTIEANKKLKLDKKEEKREEKREIPSGGKMKRGPKKFREERKFKPITNEQSCKLAGGVWVSNSKGEGGYCRLKPSSRGGYSIKQLKEMAKKQLSEKELSGFSRWTKQQFYDKLGLGIIPPKNTKHETIES